jgi:hypothetical protein
MQRRKERKKGRNEEGISINKSSRLSVSPKSLLLCVSASLREPKKRGSAIASVDQYTNQEGISRKDAKTQRKKEGKN